MAASPPPPAAAAAAAAAATMSSPAAGGEDPPPERKKRGRPRKYRPEQPSAAAAGGKRKGRPPGSGRKQQLALLGEWVAGSAGNAFAPHVITIDSGEDIASKIMSFSQQVPRAICILSANGAVSTVTLRQSVSSSGNVTFKGRFEILCLSGSYLLTDVGGSRSRTGGLSITLSSPEGHVFGGSIGGLLIAANPVQVILGSFTYGGTNAKNKAKRSDEQDAEQNIPMEDSSAEVGTQNNQNFSPPPTFGWSRGSRHEDIRLEHLGIDLTSG